LIRTQKQRGGKFDVDLNLGDVFHITKVKNEPPADSGGRYSEFGGVDSTAGKSREARYGAASRSRLVNRGEW